MSASSSPDQTSKQLLESISKMENVVAIHAPLEKAKSAAESVMKGLDAAGKLLSAVPVWGQAAKSVCVGVSKLIKLALNVTANQEMCLYLSNRIFLLHVTSLKILARTVANSSRPDNANNSKNNKNEDTAAVENILGQIKKVVDDGQKLMAPYSPRLDEQQDSNLGNAKKFAQFLSKVYTNIFDSMDREKFDEINTKIDRVNSDLTAHFVVSGAGAVPALTSGEVQNLWKQSEQDITGKVKKAVQEGNDEIKQVLGSLSSRIDGISSQVKNVQEQMSNAFAVLLKNKDFEDYKWKGDVSRLIIDKTAVLGRGGSGIVFAATDKADNFAAKLLFASEEDGNPQASARAILRECRRLTEANHSGVVRTYGLVLQRSDTYLLQERCVCTLEQLVESLGRDLLPLHVRLFYCWTLAKTYAHLHGIEFVMGDIKKSNVLINSAGKCLVSDFGSVKSMSTQTASPKELALANLGVTVAYAAPELVETQITTFQSDVFAFGCLVFETVTGKQFYKQHSALTLDETVPDPQLRRLIRRCLSPNPVDRPNMKGIDVAFEDILETNFGASGGVVVEDDLLHTVVSTYKKKAASPNAFDPNSAPSSPLSGRYSHSSTSPFPYWMSALHVSDDNKRVLVENEFDTIETVSSLNSEADFDAKNLTSIPAGARLKILQEFPKIRPFVLAFEELNPKYESELISLQREENQTWKSMLERFESSIAVEVFEKSEGRARDIVGQEFDRDVAALSEHLNRVVKFSPLLQEKVALLAETKKQQESARSQLDHVRAAFNHETEKAVAARNTNDELKIKLQSFTKELEARIAQVFPSELSTRTAQTSTSMNLEEAKKRIQSRMEEQDRNIMGELSKKFSEIESSFRQAKEMAEQNKCGKFKLKDTDGWQKDADAPNCNKCQATFGLFNRRHHCRAECGLVFCGKCSDFKLSTAFDPSSAATATATATASTATPLEEVRCCEICFNKVNAYQKFSSSLPGLEKSFNEAQKHLNDAKELLSKLEKAQKELNKLAEELSQKEDEIRQSELFSRNHEIFEKYFAAEEALNSVTNRVFGAEVEIAALGALLDPLQNFPEVVVLVSATHRLELRNAKRSHFIALVSVSEEERSNNEFLQYKSDEELFDNSASIRLIYDWPFLTKRKSEQQQEKERNTVPPIEGVQPAHLAAFVGSETFFSSRVSKGKDAFLFANTRDKRSTASFAAMLGNVGLLKLLLSHGLPINASSENGLTPVHWAACAGSMEGTKVLVDAGFNKDATTEKSGYQPIMLACFFNRAGVVNYLVNTAGCEVGRTKVRSASPLHCACLAGAVETVKILLSAGKCNKNEVQEGSLTPLIFAAQQGNVDLVKLLVSVGADVKAKSNLGYDAFHAACHYGQTEVVKYFLGQIQVAPAAAAAASSSSSTDAHPEIDFSSRTSTVGKITPLLSAAKEGHLDIVKLLLESGKIDKEEKDDSGRNAVGRAAIAKKPDVIRYLISVGVDPEAKYTDNTEFRPIHSASRTGDLDTLRALLDTPLPASPTRRKATINVDPRTQSRATPLQLVCKLDQLDAALEMARYLIEQKGADKESVNQHNYGSLLCAAEMGNLALFQYLVEEQKLNIECSSSAGTTVLMAAAGGGHEAVVEYILANHTINKEATNKNGSTALLIAAQSRHSSCVRKLIEYGCAVNHQNNNQFNAFLAACHMGDLESVKHLCAANCDQVAKTKLGNGALHLASLTEKEENFEEAAKLIEFLLYDDTGLAKTSHFKTKSALNDQGENKRTPLSLAAERGNVSAMKVLLSVPGIAVEVDAAAAVSNATPLLYLSTFSTPRAAEGARLLISHKANKEATASDGLTPLLRACKFNFPVAKLLISSGANKKAVGPNNWMCHHFAAAHNQRDTLKYLIESIGGFDPNAKTKLGSTILMLAVLENCVDVVNYLLDGAADEYFKLDLEARDSEGRNVLHFALWPKDSKASLDLVKVLLTHEATANATWRTSMSESLIENDIKKSPLHLAAESASTRFDIFKYICELTPADKRDAADTRNNTPLFYALVGGSLAAATLLHEEYKCSVNAVSSASGTSTLMLAAAMAPGTTVSLAACKYLIEHGADKNYVNPKTGSNALLEAVSAKNVAAAEYLLKQPGFSITNKDAKGLGVLYRAVLANSPEMVKFLLSASGIELNVGSFGEQQSPLHVAAAQGFTEIVKLLVAAGCNKSAQNKSGKTPYEVAVAAKHTETADACKP